jgi:zinc D-Ala-D-Ala carboxypeptidase
LSELLEAGFDIHPHGGPASLPLRSGGSLSIARAMASDGITAVQARIAEIESRFGVAVGRSAPVDSGERFSAALAMARSSTYVATPATLGVAVAATGPVTPPPELQDFGNGKIPPDVLVPIGDGTERLHAPAATAFRRMATEAWQAGIDLKVNDGYRSLVDQERLAVQLGLYRDGGKAAVPGTSNHGWGLSVDLDTDDRSRAWLRANAASFGFVEDVDGEPWHWTYRPAT